MDIHVGPGGPASAGAPASPPAVHVVDEPSRLMPNGWTVTASMLGGVDPNTVTQEFIENVMCE